VVGGERRGELNAEPWKLEKELEKVRQDSA